MDKNQHPTNPTATAAHVGQLVWVATYPDGGEAQITGVFASRRAAVASVADDLDCWDAGPVEEDHYQPTGEQHLWTSTWCADSGYLTWTVAAHRLA